MSVAWVTASRGERVIPCVLIAGLPVILIPEGVTLTGWSAGALDAAWWPGSSFGGFSTYLRSWLSLSQSVTWSERAQPVQPEMLDVSSLDIRVSDIGLRSDGTGGLATTLFADVDSIAGTWITADVTTTSTTVAVSSTAGFAASGYLYLGRETMAYTSTTGTSFAVGSAANRGRFGSPVQYHSFVGNANAAVSNPQVLSAAPEIIGRVATVWLLRVSATGVVTDGMLAFYGVVGTGPMLSEDGESWTLRLDHIIKRLATPLRGETVSVGGYTHLAPSGSRGAASTSREVQRSYCPTYDWVMNAAMEVRDIFTLTRDAAAPDNGGWHADAGSYITDLNIACRSSGAIYSLDGNGRLNIIADVTGNETLVLGWPWDFEEEATEQPVSATQYRSAKAFPGAWVPVFTASRIYVTASDYALIPATPSSAIASVYYALAFDGENDRVNYARITGKDSSGSLYWITVDAITRDEASTTDIGVLGAGFVVTEPSSARIVCYVQSADWISAIQALMESFTTSIAETIVDAFDFNDMRSVAARYPVGPYGVAREYVVDLTESILDLLTRECRLNGYTLVISNGRISITRIADFAPTEVTSGSISTADLHSGYPVPSYSRGVDGIVNAVSFSAPPPLNITVNVVDATSLTAYGPGRAKLEARAPVQITGTVVNPAAEYLRLAAQAMQVLGPLRYPYELVTLTTPLHKADLGVGDTVTLTLWRVPSQSATRGISLRMAQVMGREHVFYDDGDGRVTYTMRLSPTRLVGWAPAALVDELGISGGDISLDLTTFGSAGFAPGGTVGGADWFVVGDVVRLVQIGSASPAASTTHTVTAVSGSTLTVTPNPNATFVALAAVRLAVMVIAEDWTGATASQQRYAYLADTSYRLDTTTAARIYAA